MRVMKAEGFELRVFGLGFGMIGFRVPEPEREFQQIETVPTWNMNMVYHKFSEIPYCRL